MEQRYASQLYDCSNASIAKALLLQMPNVSFTQYRNELARVLGTHQHPSKGVSTKAVSATQEGTESEEEKKADSKSWCKREPEDQRSVFSDQGSLSKARWGNCRKRLRFGNYLTPQHSRQHSLMPLQASGQNFRTRGKFFGKR